ncbi:MAG: DUF4440 domain-containing protein [Caldilineaceae bacterium]|nr:DUF4440 domain-containing protein [Caldilineaceae bacterium]
MIDHCRSEIKQLHRFFEQWFQATIPNTDEAFARLPAVIHPSFALISPEGSRTERQALLTWIRNTHGARPSLRLWTEQIEPVYVETDLALLVYHEWQEGEAARSARISSALFRRAADAPCGVQWVHVHETWLPQPSSKS